MELCLGLVDGAVYHIGKQHNWVDSSTCEQLREEDDLEQMKWSNEMRCPGIVLSVLRAAPFV